MKKYVEFYSSRCRLDVQVGSLLLSSESEPDLLSGIMEPSHCFGDIKSNAPIERFVCVKMCFHLFLLKCAATVKGCAPATIIWHTVCAAFNTAS